MSPCAPTSQFDPLTSYTMPQFLELCQLDEKIIRFVIYQIVTKRVSENFSIHSDQIKATGAELMAAIDGAESLMDQFRRHPVILTIPGWAPISLTDQLPVLMTEMYRQRCK